MSLTSFQELERGQYDGTHAMSKIIRNMVIKEVAIESQDTATAVEAEKQMNFQFQLAAWWQNGPRRGKTKAVLREKEFNML